MATLKNKRKLAAVSRETPEGTRSSRAQDVLDPEIAQDFISQVSEEIEGRVTKKLSKEFSKTESRILGALSQIDAFLLNPQVRTTCSVAVPGTSRNSNSENREITGDHSSDDPCPEVGYFSHHSCHLSSPEAENNPHTPILEDLLCSTASSEIDPTSQPGFHHHDQTSTTNIRNVLKFLLKLLEEIVKQTTLDESIFQSTNNAHRKMVRLTSNFGTSVADTQCKQA